MHSQRVVARHVLVALSFVLLFLLLNRPEVILLSRVGLIAWYPAIGLAMALMLGLSPWYALLVCVAIPIGGKLIYGLPIKSSSYTVDAIAIAVCYGAAAYTLREYLHIDLELRQRRDVVMYVFVSGISAVVAAAIGAVCLVADHSISWGEFETSAGEWFLGDSIGLLGVAPMLRKWRQPAVSWN